MEDTKNNVQISFSPQPSTASEMSDYAKLNYDVWNEIFPIRTHRTTTIASPPNSGVLYNLAPTFDTSDSREKRNLDLSKITRFIEEEDRVSLNSSQCHEVQLAGSAWRISLDDQPGGSVQPTHIKNDVADMCTRRSLPPVPAESVYDSIKPSTASEMSDFSPQPSIASEMSDNAKLNYDVWNEIFPIRTHCSTKIANLNYDVWNEIFPIRTHRSTTIASPSNSGVLYNLAPSFDTFHSREKRNLDLSKITRFIEEEDRVSLNSSQCHEVQLAGSAWRISLDDQPGGSVQPTHIKNDVADMCTRRSLPPVPAESVYDSIKINKRQWTCLRKCIVLGGSLLVIIIVVSIVLTLVTINNFTNGKRTTYA